MWSDTIKAVYKVRMAEWSKALRSGRSPLLWAWVRIPLLTTNTFFLKMATNLAHNDHFKCSYQRYVSSDDDFDFLLFSASKKVELQLYIA